MTAIQDPVSKAEWLERARSLRPIIEKFRDEAERQRRLPAPLFEAMRETGLYSIVVPIELGGAGVPLATYIEVIEEISRQDGSVGWNAFIGPGGGLFADYLPENAAREVFAAGDAVIA